MSTEKAGFFDIKTKFQSHQSFERPLNLTRVLNGNMRNGVKNEGFNGLFKS